MADRHTLTVYKGRNSPLYETISLDGVAIDFATSMNLTSMSIIIAGVEYSSTDGWLTFEDAGVVTFLLGSIPTPPSGRNIGRLVIYNATYPLGRAIITEKTNTQYLFEFV